MRTLMVQKQKFDGELMTELANNILLVTVAIDQKPKDIRKIIGEDFLIQPIDFTIPELEIFNGKRTVKHIMSNDLKAEILSFNWNMKPYKSENY